MTSPNGRQVFRRPLVAFDGSSHAEAALAQAVELVQASHGRLSIITVVPEPSLWALGGTYWAPLDLGVIGRQVERGYQSLLDEAVEAVPADVPVTKILGSGLAGPAIVSEITRTSSDVVVMGSRGRGGLHSLLLGSVSRYVLARSPVPVRVVHLSAADGGAGRWTVMPKTIDGAHEYAQGSSHV